MCVTQWLISKTKRRNKMVQKADVVLKRYKFGK